MFEWRQEYAFGLDDIDKQHQRLFAIGHNLEDACNDTVSNQYAAIKEALLELDDYTGYHFDYEEDWMSLIGFSATITHQEEHDFFTRKIADFKSSDNIESPSLIEMLSFLSRWIIHHIMTVDIEYVKDIKYYREKHTSLL